MTRWAVVADLNRCVGCQTCTAACKHANATAPGVQWRKVLDVEAGEYPDVRRAFVPVGCMHCDEPPCLEVCPTTATRKRGDGIVTIDYDLCIGCAYCVVACPYQARYRVDAPASAYGSETMRHEALRENSRRLGVSQKCTFCFERIDEGLAKGLTPGVDPDATPACVASCIADALHFGDLEDPDSNVSRLLTENTHSRMHETLGTGPGIYYLTEPVAGNGDAGKANGSSPAPMNIQPEPAQGISPVLQQTWDWRAAANFMAGGAGSGLFLAAFFAGLGGMAAERMSMLALLLVALGLGCVWLEIGRPWRFLNVFFHPQSSWMTREAIAACGLFAFGLPAIALGSVALGAAASICAAAFLYSQARIIERAKGIPAWREPAVGPLVVATGLSEGVGLLVMALVVQGSFPVLLWPLQAAMLVLLAGRYFAWKLYRGALSERGAPTGTMRTFNAVAPSLVLGGHALPALLIVLSMFAGSAEPALIALAGGCMFAAGWFFKFALIRRAAFNQGYALERMPARGGGLSAPGIQPGWTVQ